jgi:CDP-diacylglycerol---glycerol-3-phosphate 3-phosphatidyltransferase
MNLANTITLARFPLLIVIVLLLYFGGVTGRWIAVPLVLLLIVMDAIDGIVARQRREETLLGSVLDIAADRAIEIILWVVYAQLDLIPLLIPIVVIIRGSLTDSIREAGYDRGQTAHALMTTSWGKWLVAGRPMRAAYGIVKAVAFVLLAVTLALQAMSSQWTDFVWLLASAASWISLVLCIVRGIPVLFEARAWDRQQ